MLDITYGTVKTVKGMHSGNTSANRTEKRVATPVYPVIFTFGMEPATLTATGYESKRIPFLGLRKTDTTDNGFCVLIRHLFACPKVFSWSQTSMTPFGSEIVFKEVETALAEKRGSLLGRFGTIECETLYCLKMQPGAVNEHQRGILERNAGVFPSDPASVRMWAERTRQAFQSADVLATGWYAPMVKMEKELLEGWDCSGAKHVSLRALEPYYVTEKQGRWTSLLAGRRVCVVTSFADTIARQVQKGEEAIWPDASGSLWAPGVSWSFVQTGYAPVLACGRAGWEDSPETWEQAVTGVVNEVDRVGAEIVLIGCGGLGMVIGGLLKKRGKICIVMGGAVQVLFGVKGERWRNHSVIGSFWNAEWSWPSAAETPAAAVEVESGCYWRRA